MAQTQTAATSEGSSPRSIILGGAESIMMNGGPGETPDSITNSISDNKPENHTTESEETPSDSKGKNSSATTSKSTGGESPPSHETSTPASASSEDNNNSNNNPATSQPPSDHTMATSTAVPPTETHLYATAAASGTAYAAMAPPLTTFVANPFAPGAASPLSPPRTTAATTATTTNASIPPASPLFPRLNHAPTSTQPNEPDATTTGNTTNSFGYANGTAAYPSYSTVVAASQLDEQGWTADRTTQQPSPQVTAQLMNMPYVAANNARADRSYSFESDSMLPPPMEGHDPATATSNPAYSPYGATTSTGSPNQQQQTPTLFPQAWGFGGPLPPDMYGAAPASPLQPRPTHHHHPMMAANTNAAAATYGQGPPPPMNHPHAHHMNHPHPHMNHHHPHPQGAMPMGVMNPHPGMRGMPPFGQYPGFPAAQSSSPGPPIQTTASNKGPDGANLFIFHIPNHFTNLDMYQLFEPYGSLLSVRIMVEKDTGRSRGFGFVSYDSPESAALAIKALNGFAIGNKRLKVQHKQIRQKDMMMHNNNDRGGMDGGYDAYGHAPGGMPPSGQGWSPEGMLVKDEGTELTSTTSTVGDPQQHMTGANGGGPDETSSPLANLGALQSALPDVGATAGGEQVTE